MKNVVLVGRKVPLITPLPVNASCPRRLQPEEKAGLASLALRLVCQASEDSAGEAQVAELIQRFLAANGAAAELTAVPPPADSRMCNLEAQLPGRGQRTLILCGHMDTVPCPRPGQPGGEIREGWLCGRGSCDMKGALAAMVTAFLIVKREKWDLEGSLRLLLTGDEESSGLGARLATAGKPGRSGHGDDASPAPAVELVTGEPTGLAVAVAEKGALWLEVTVDGVGGHGGLPELGVNAVAAAAGAITSLGSLLKTAERRDLGKTSGGHPLLGPATWNVGSIRGGTVPNLIPDSCTFTVDIRTLPGADHLEVVQGLERALADHFGKTAPGRFPRARVRMVGNRPPLEISPDGPLPTAARQAAARVTGTQSPPIGVAYFTDNATLVPAWDCPWVILGPGSPGQMHKPDEKVALDELTMAAETYLELIRKRLCPGGSEIGANLA